MNRRIVETPDKNEIMEALLGMNRDGAPGPDGFSVHFYIYAWEVISKDLVAAIQHFLKGFQPSTWSATTLSLIPKIKDAHKIDNLRPISLCNVSHKVISRILGNRLGEILPDIISPEQAGFVKDRNIHENIVLAHDMAHDIHKQGKDGNAILKLDMSKAYDRISWTFLIRAMRAFGFCEQWCDLVYRCISNSWYSIFLENKMYGYFKSSCGVRQGDPLSPSLFVIAMEWISRAINRKVEEGKIKHFSTKHGVVKINHLMFADDVLIFTKDCPQSLVELIQTIRDFRLISGEVLNPAKSQIFFSKNSTKDRRKQAVDVTSFLESTLPTKYLGAPLMQGRVKIEYFTYLLDNMEKRVSG